jgi:hypothetical protein
MTCCTLWNYKREFRSAKCKCKKFQIRTNDVKEQGTVGSDNITTQQQMES